jgi:hypothetical protein
MATMLSTSVCKSTAGARTPLDQNYVWGLKGTLFDPKIGAQLIKNASASIFIHLFSLKLAPY